MGSKAGTNRDARANRRGAGTNRRDAGTIRRSAVYFCVLCLLSGAARGLAQDKKPENKDGAEQRELEQAVGEAGTSTIDFIRALEKHLAKYPKSTRKPEIERALAKASIEVRDHERIVRYGERVLASEPDDMLMLERVSRALLASDDKAPAERALKYATRLEELVRDYEKKNPASGPNAAKVRDDVDRTLGRALLLEARADGNLGKLAEALDRAQKSYDTFPTAESAREIGKWLAKAGKEREAIPRYADALLISDARATDADRELAREKLGDLQRKLSGSEKGLGDELLAAYDRTTALLRERQLKLKGLDPNAASNAGDFTLSGLSGEKLALSSLRGKVVVMDFWATWCGPCRAQHPLYQEVMQRFKKNPDVIFLSVNTDEQRDGVAEFLDAHKWDKKVYFEDGLSAKLQVSSIPTTVLLDRRGEVASRMNGFIPDRFVDMLSQRIEQVLAQ